MPNRKPSGHKTGPSETAPGKSPPPKPTGMDLGEYLEFFKKWSARALFDANTPYGIAEFRIEQLEERRAELEHPIRPLAEASTIAPAPREKADRAGQSNRQQSARDPRRRASQPSNQRPFKKIKLEPHSNPEALLANKNRVTYGTTAIIFGVTPRRIRQLVAEERLTSLGVGNAKRIDVDSIRRRLNS